MVAQKRHNTQKNKRHFSDIQQSLAIKPHLVDKPNLILLHQKAERLTVAMYMVTDLFDDREPLKWELRERAVKVVSFIVQHSQRTPISHERLYDHSLIEVVTAVLVPLELAMHMRRVSKMNFSLLRDEYQSLVTLLASCREEAEGVNDVTLPDQFFVYDHTHDEVVAARGEGREKYKRQNNIKDKIVTSSKTQDKKTNQPSDLKQLLQSISPAEVSSSQIRRSDTRPSQRSTPVDSKKNDRRMSIIQILKTRGELTIKDISSVVDNCSEKTIQRELMSLIEDGRVMKRGERRWSTYSLV